MEKLIAELKVADSHEPVLSDEQKVEWKLERVRTRLAEKLRLICQQNRGEPALNPTNDETLRYADRVLRGMFGIPAKDAPFAQNLSPEQRANLLEQLVAAYQLTTVLLDERARMVEEVANAR